MQLKSRWQIGRTEKARNRGNGFASDCRGERIRELEQREVEVVVCVCLGGWGGVNAPNDDEV